MDACRCSDEDSPYDLSILLDASVQETGLGESDLENILGAIRFTLERHDKTRCAVSVRLVDDATMAELHESSMGIPEPSDVLTFDLSDESDPPSPPAVDVRGDVVISVETAAREANARGHGVVQEIMLYAVHAALHLLGFDDHDDDEAARMHAEEDEILSAMGAGPVYGRPFA